MTVLFAISGGFAIAYSAMTMLALTMTRHQRQLGNLSPFQHLIYRGAGIGCLSLSFFVITVPYGASSGMVLWLGLLTVICLMLGALLAYAPKRAAQSGKLAAFISLVSLLVLLIFQ